MRCADWKNNHSLFIADVKSVPNNAKANLNAGLAYIEMAADEKGLLRKQELDSAKKYLLIGIKIFPEFADGYLNMGLVYNWNNNFDSAEVWWNKARVINPNAVNLQQYDKVLSQHFLQIGLKNGVDKNFEASIFNLNKAFRYDSLNAEISYNLGGAYFTINNFKQAKRYFEKTVQLNPANKDAQAGLQVANLKLNK